MSRRAAVVLLLGSLSLAALATGCKPSCIESASSDRSKRLARAEQERKDAYSALEAEGYVFVRSEFEEGSPAYDEEPDPSKHTVSAGAVLVRAPDGGIYNVVPARTETRKVRICGCEGGQGTEQMPIRYFYRIQPGERWVGPLEADYTRVDTVYDYEYEMPSDRCPAVP